MYQYFDKQVEDVILERPGELDCFSRNLTFSMPKPKFNEFTYVGQSVLNYQHANHWVISDHSGRHVVQYWDNVESGEPMQVCLRWCLRCVCAPAVCARAGGLCVCVFVCVCVCVCVGVAKPRSPGVWESLAFMQLRGGVKQVGNNCCLAKGCVRVLY